MSCQHLLFLRIVNFGCSPETLWYIGKIKIKTAMDKHAIAVQKN